MDLIFNLKRVHPRPEFKGKDFPDDFGSFSRYEIPIKFQGKHGWQSFTYGFIFDTGAYISYAPQSILEILEVDPVFEGIVHGILQEHQIIAKMARISFKIVDEHGYESKPISSWFAFYPFESGPRLLGMKELLENIGFSKAIDQDSLILSVPD